MSSVDYRDLAVKKLTKYLGDDLSTDQIKVLENGIYNFSIQHSNENSITPSWKSDLFIKIYDDKLVSILSNMDPTSYICNEELLEKIKSNDLKIQDIASMDATELNSKRWLDIMRIQSIKEENSLTNKITASTNLFKCGKCKQKKCTYYEMQVRSADEPSTIFITCLNCENKWRIG